MQPCLSPNNYNHKIVFMIPKFHLPRRRSLRFLLLGAGFFFGLCLIGFAALWLLTPDPTEAVLSRPVSPVLLDDKGRMINARLSSKGEWCIPIPLNKMGRWLPKVLVAVEDKRFYDHGGVDFLALGRSAYLNLKHGRVVSGASTISTQLVRLSTPRERTVATKVLEFLGAWKLERSLTKDEILEQ